MSKRFNSDVRVGAIFSNGRGLRREIVGIGEQFKLYDSQTNTDCLRYIPWRQDRKNPDVWHRGCEANITRDSFLAWVKELVRPS